MTTKDDVTVLTPDDKQIYDLDGGDALLTVRATDDAERPLSYTFGVYRPGSRSVLSFEPVLGVFDSPSTRETIAADAARVLAAGHGADEKAVREDALDALEELTRTRKEGDLLILGEKAGKIARKTHRVEYDADRGRWSVQFTSGEAFTVNEEEFAKPFASAGVSQMFPNSVAGKSALSRDREAWSALRSYWVSRADVTASE